MLQKSICDKPYGDKPYGNRIGDIATFCFAAVVVSWTFILVMVCFVVAIMYKLYRLVREQREQQGNHGMLLPLSVFSKGVGGGGELLE